MMADVATLRTLVRVRKQGLDAARQALAGLIAAETAAAESLREAEASIRREQELASALEATDAAVESFAAWLPQARRAVAAAAQALSAAEGATAQGRARLATARAAAEAVERMLDAQVAAERTEQARRLQLTLDDLAHGRPARE